MILMIILNSSFGKESSCNEGGPSSIPGLWRSAGEGIDYPLLYSWASRLAQLVKNQPEIQETWVQSLGWEDALEKGKATHSSIPWRIPWTVQSMGSQRVRHDWVTFDLSLFHSFYSFIISWSQHAEIGSWLLLLAIYNTQIFEIGITERISIALKLV